MAKFAVVEIYERVAESFTECATLEEAVETANKLLREHVEDLDRQDEFEKGNGKEVEWGLATESYRNAWCNWRDDWDAHIVEY